MSLARRFLSTRFSKSFKEFNQKEEVTAAAADQEAAVEDFRQTHGATWSSILPELLGEIIGHLEATEDRAERRKYVIACAGVCKRWRDITKEAHNYHLNSGMITFPSCLKRPGPSDLYHQCLIKRNMKTSTFYLYLALSPSLTEKGKFLLAARRYRRPSHVEYIISLQAHDYSQGSNAYLGKLCSDFLGTKFTIYDSEPPHNGARALSTKGSRRFASKQISPQLSSGNFEVGQVSYKFNILKSRGPRRMVCNLKFLNSSSSSGQTSTSSTKPVTPIDENLKMKDSELCLGTESMVLKNKAPKWHEPLQCWCLNFHGRVTQASVKNFQLVSAVEGDEETVVLQFGKVDTHLFTMDFRQPLVCFSGVRNLPNYLRIKTCM